MPTTSEKRATFRRLHESGCFVIPNPWDVGSTRYLQGMGFKALATTSAGFAWSRGLGDGGVTREMALAHFAEIAAAADVPVNADFEDGFATMPTDVARNVKIATTTGIAGLSIEDSSGDEAEPLFDFTLAVERISAARRAIDESGTGILLTARSEGFIVGRPDLAETIKRLTAYAEAGADCLYAPGLSTTQDVSAVVKAVAPKPVNVLVGSDFTTVAELAVCGKRAVLIPFPYAADNHQEFNARTLAERGQAELIIQKDLTAERLAGLIKK